MAIEIKLPTLHSGQVEIWKNRTKRNIIRCGRRWGKTKLLTTIAGSSSAHGQSIGIFTPEHKQWLEIWDELKTALQPITQRATKQEGALRLTTGGKIDFWAINDNDLAGRGREYHKVLIDEGAFAKKGSIATWKKSIQPTLLTTRGDAWVFSTPFGIDPENMFYDLCNNPEHGFKEFHAPTRTNPYVPLDELEKYKQESHPDVFRQEYLAEFVDFSGTAFFPESKLLVEGQGVAYPEKCDGVFAIIDTAIKTGKDNDGTAVTYFAVNRFHGYLLIILDWDIVQVEGALLETWLPTVFQRLDELARVTGARNGSLGTWIEDKASGQILLQQALRRSWPAQAIEGNLTSVGKDERAISVSGYVHTEKVKLSAFAHDKITMYKGQSRNHFITQVCGYRVGVKDQADDLLDCFTYGISIALGNYDGY